MKFRHILSAALTFGAAVPGLSQTSDHSSHDTKPKTQDCTPEHAAMGHCKIEKSVEAPKPAKEKPSVSDPSCAPEHAAMGHCTPKETSSLRDKGKASEAPKPANAKPSVSDPSCSPEHAAMGHCTPKESARPENKSDKASKADDPDCPAEHAAMGHCTPKKSATGSKTNGNASGTNLPPGNAPAPEAPEVNYADRVWGREAMAKVRDDMYQEHGGMFSSLFLLDLAATKDQDGEDGYEWAGEAWLGGDLNRIVFKTEGESYSDEEVESAEVQAVYSRAIGPYFNLQAGLRYDFRPEPSKTYAAFGFEGLAPYWNEVEGTLFISEEGDLLGRLEGRYDQLITQRLVLGILAEINLSAQEMEDEEIGSGLVDTEFGLRLHYEIKREIAPYLGVSWENSFGETARFARAHGEDENHFKMLAGLRLWM